jgi:hypothetical protein
MFILNIKRENFGHNLQEDYFIMIVSIFKRFIVFSRLFPLSSPIPTARI